jgi:cytochrome c-type biogenesis protein CcmH
MRRPVVGLVLLALLGGGVLAAPAGAEKPRTSLPDIEDEVMCVTCNVPLNIAESPQASRQREMIRTEIAKGRTKEEVKARLVEEYGQAVLAMPRRDGVGFAAYAVPIAASLLGVALLVALVPRWRRRTRVAGQAPAVAAGSAPASDAELRRLDDDLRRFD